MACRQEGAIAGAAMGAFGADLVAALLQAITAAEDSISRWQQQLAKGRARDTFVVGALLTLPGASYIAGMNSIHDQSLSTVATVVCIVGFNLIMLLLLEIPLIGYTLAPDATPHETEETHG